MLRSVKIMANKSLKKAQWTTRGPGIFTSEEESSDEEETVLTEIMQTVKIVAEVKVKHLDEMWRYAFIITALLFRKRSDAIKRALALAVKADDTIDVEGNRNSNLKPAAEALP